ncbi:hypothetical protein SLS60_002599 [Paraconiothyrium brasiliense]|uniref:Uncharacterized protein n=1 Tax=Paraconiothyrium brasiliense TaxID=300254 RepID=A0ABR3RU90_9PLEO
MAWTVRFLWNCHEIYRAKELPWKTVYKLLIDAVEDTGIGRKFTREASEKLQEKLLEEFANKETTRDSSPSPRSGAADDVEQTPLSRSTTRANEQATPTSSSSQLVERVRNITSPSPPVRTAAPRPSATSAGSPTGSPGRSDLPSVQPPSRPPVQREPLGRRDEFNASVHCETPPQLDTAPSDPTRTTGQAEGTQHQSLTDLASSGDSTAPSQTEEDTQLRHDAMVEDLNSFSALSTQTLSHILYTFLPTQKIVISKDGSPDLLPVRVLDLCTLLHPSSSEQAESQETLTWNGTNSFSCDSRDIEAWPPSKLDRNGITTFVLPFTDSSTNDSVIYILCVREKTCFVRFFADMQGNIMLARTIPTKLIETVADSGDATSWKIELQSHTEELSWLNSGLRVFERCLHYTFSPQRNERDVVATDEKLSFLRAALATFFDDPTKVVHFERWLSGEWSSQRSITLRGKTGAQVPIPNTKHAAFRYLPRYLQSCEDLGRVRQRQSRLADALNYHIPNLEAWFNLAVERLDSWLGKLKAQQDTAKAKTEKDLEEFYQKMILMHKGLFIGKDKEFYEARARDHMGLLKPKTYEELERNLRRLQIQESDAQNRKESYLQFQNVLQTAKGFAQREKVTEDDKVSKAETREAQLYLEEWDAFTKEQEERAQAREFMLSLAPPTTLAGNQNRVNKEGDRATQQPQSRSQPSDSTADADLHDSPQSDKSGEVASLGEAMHAIEASSKNSDPPAPRDAGYRLQTRQNRRESEAATLLHSFQKRNSVSTAGVQGSGESTDAPGDDLDLV